MEALDAIETTGTAALAEMRRLVGVLRDDGQGWPSRHHPASGTSGRSWRRSAKPASRSTCRSRERRSDSHPGWTRRPIASCRRR